MKSLSEHFLLGLAGCMAIGVCAELARGDEFIQSFRGLASDLQDFRPTGNALDAMTAEPEGLRITLASYAGRIPVGLFYRMRIRGDFEITMTYELLRVDKPVAGSGAGVSIWINTASSTNEAGTISRIVRPNGDQVYSVHRASTVSGGQRQDVFDEFPANSKSGKMRLARVGNILQYLVASDESDDFEEIHKTYLGADEVDTIRFAAQNDGSPSIVDVRLKGVGIRADEIGLDKPGSARGGWAIWLGVLVGVILVAGFWMWRRRQWAAQLEGSANRSKSRF